MQREIKFRAWNEGQMIYTTDEFRSEQFLTTAGDILNRFDTVMQFTGLKDKNGKDIYEGDIVKLNEAAYIFTVNWVDYQFKLVHIKYNKMDWGCIGRIADLNFNVEIIGNIYENPELTKPAP